MKSIYILCLVSICSNKRIGREMGGKEIGCSAYGASNPIMREAEERTGYYIMVNNWGSDFEEPSCMECVCLSGFEWEFTSQGCSDPKANLKLCATLEPDEAAQQKIYNLGDKNDPGCGMQKMYICHVQPLAISLFLIFIFIFFQL